jgi:hypothetical protein
MSDQTPIEAVETFLDALEASDACAGLRPDEIVVTHSTLPPVSASQLRALVEQIKLDRHRLESTMKELAATIGSRDLLIIELDKQAHHDDGQASGVEDVDDDTAWNGGMEATCHVCGCTDNEACDGGCVWVSNSLGIDLCSTCAHSIARDAVAAGIYTPRLSELGTDGGDPDGRSPAAHRVHERIVRDGWWLPEDADHVRTLSREHDALLQLARTAEERHRRELAEARAELLATDQADTAADGGAS